MPDTQALVHQLRLFHRKHDAQYFSLDRARFQLVFHSVVISVTVGVDMRSEACKQLEIPIRVGTTQEGSVANFSIG